jgi:gluconolactonase
MPMTSIRSTLYFLLVAPGLNGQEPLALQRPTGDPAIVAPTARLEKVFGNGINTEGPSVAPDGSVYFVDVPLSRDHPRQAGRIWRFDVTTGTTAIYRSPSGKALGIRFDQFGRMVVAEFADFGGRRITRTNLSTGDAEIVAALYQGKPFNSPNDLTIDEQGRIYFTDYGFAAPHEMPGQPVDGVYRIDADGSVARIITGVGLPNGIAISPNQQILYVTSGRFDFQGRRAILAFNLSAEGNATFRSVFALYEPGTVTADGMAVDVEGNLYATLFSRTGRTGVAVYSAEGVERAFIPTPEPAKNVTFGRGATAKVLYITAGRSLYRINVQKVGYQLPIFSGRP